MHCHSARGNWDDTRDEGGEKGEPGNLEGVIEVGRKTREEGQRQRVTSNHSRKIRLPSEFVASREGPEPRYERRRTGSGRAKERQKSARNPRRVLDVMLKTGGTWVEGERNVETKKYWFRICRPWRTRG